MNTTVEESLNQLVNAQFSNDYEFHANLTTIFQTLKDSNTRYTKPTCYSQFTFVQPFSLTSSVQTINNTLQQFLYVLKADPTVASYYPQLYSTMNVTSFSVYEKLRVLQIDGVDAMQYMSKSETTFKLTFIVQNCAMTSPRSKDTQVAFNHCLLRDWQIRYMNIFNAPTALTITYTLQNDTSGEIFYVPANWVVAILFSSSSTTNFAQLCVQQDDSMLYISIFI
jgi:hypothetical protein